MGNQSIKTSNSGRYFDIINLEHPTSKKHPRMSMENRAAQFSPFAALTGYNDAVMETARLTDRRIEPADDVIEEINRALMCLKDKINNTSTPPEVKIKYFVPDHKKTGGKYVDTTLSILKIDEYNHTLVSTNQTVIPIHNILNISIT